MKVFLHYEESEDTSLHKTLKITLPKSWKNGPTSKLLHQFVESYNAGDKGTKSPLDASNLHLSTRRLDSNEETIIIPLPSDAITIEVIDDREDIYICHGPSETLKEIENKKKEEQDRRKAELANTVVCAHFGCNKRFPRGGPYPDCSYHSGPPVFHETAKFWSCCPNKKAYDWEEFQKIDGCQKGVCTEVRDDATTGKQFLGGCDLREAAGESQKLKSIDDFNSAQAAGGSDAAPVLDRLRGVFAEIGIENELFDQVVNGIKNEYRSEDGEDDVLAATTDDLGKKLKKAMKNIAVNQLRIN